jgi:hypothetical protein
MKPVNTFTLLCFAVFGSLALLSTAYAQDRVRCAIHTINLNMAYDVIDSENFARRLDTIANLLLRDLDSGNRSWDLIGLSGAYSKRQGTFVTLKEMSHPCRCYNAGHPGWTAGKKLTTRCLASYLQKKKGWTDEVVPKIDINHQKGEIGLIAREEKYDVLDGVVYKKLLGRTWFGMARKRVLGTRLRIKDTGHILPFYATHISSGVQPFHPGTSANNTTKQVRDLVSAIKNWWHPGDLTPIVVGTFNFKRGTRCYDIMSKDFDEVGHNYGYDRIEQVWIGKETSFPGALGRMEAVRYEDLGVFDSDSTGLSDYSVCYVELLTPGPDVRDLTIDHCNFQSRFALGSQPKVRCDRYELKFSWACNYIPRFTLLVDGHPYHDPRDNSSFAHRLCPQNTGSISVPVHFLVSENSYAHTVTVELERPDCSRTIDIQLGRPAIEVFPFLHQGYAYTAMDTQNPEQFIQGVTEAHRDVQVIDENPTQDEIEALWDRRVFVHGRPIGDPNDPNSLIVGFVINYKLGYVAEPIFCNIRGDALVNPVNLSATITKGQGTKILEQSIVNDLPLENCLIFDGFTEQDYYDRISLTFDVEAIDDAGQRCHGRQSFFANSLLCIVRPDYSELLFDLNSGSVKDRIHDSVTRELFMDLLATLGEDEKAIAQQRFPVFKNRIANLLRASLAKVQRDRNLWRAFKTAQREHYIDTEQKIFKQFASQKSFAEAQARIEPLREIMIERALSTPIEILAHATVLDLKEAEAVSQLMENLLFEESNGSSWPP